MSPLVRQILYIITAIGTPVVAYLNVKGILDSDAVALWSAEVAVVGGLAAIKTTGKNDVQVEAPATFDVIPADQATSDTKADAAYSPRHAEK